MAKSGSLFKKSYLGSLNVNFQNCINSRWMLYAVFFLAASDLYIFAVNGELFFVALFVLIGFLTTFFSKNMSVILFVAMILTNILRFGKDIRVTEGMEDGGAASAVGDTSTGSEITIPNMDSEEGGDYQFLEKGDSKKAKPKTKEPLIESIVSSSDASGPSSNDSSATPASANTDMATKLAIAEITKTLASSPAPAGATVASPIASPVAAPVSSNKSTPVSTNNISKTIEGLDQDTLNLLQKQQKLLENMENLKPLLSNAERFLQNFNTNV